MSTPSPPLPRAVMDARWRQARHALATAAGDAPLEALEALARMGHAPSQCDLGRALCHGVASAPDVAAGLGWLRRGEAAGDARATYSLAVVGLTGLWQPLDPSGAARRLQRAAQAGFAPALRGLALALRRADDAQTRRLATTCLAHAAARGDGIAVRLQARDGPNRITASLPPPLPLLPVPDLAPALALPATSLHRLLNAAPRVAVAEAALTRDECDLVILLGMPYLRRSAAVDPMTGAPVALPLRTSRDAVFDPIIEDVTLALVQQRMAAFADKPLSCAEPMVLLRYGPGEEYRPHRDYLPPSRVVPAAAGGSGQRDRTVVAYLNTPTAGGDTDFPELDMRIPARRGNLLRFDNLDAQGRPEPRSLHAGAPVREGEKWICTLWFHEGRERR